MNMDVSRAQKILIVKNRAIGDSLIGLASVNYVKSALPGAVVDYAVPSGVAPLYENLETAADNIVPLETGSLPDFIGLAGRLRGRYDVIIELSQAGRTGLFFRIFSACSRTHYYFHNHHKKTGAFIQDQGVVKPIVQRDLDGVYSALKHFLGKDMRAPVFTDFAPKVSLKGPAPERNARKIVLGLAAAREEKCWPAGHYRELCRLLTGHYPDFGFLIPLSPSKADQALKAEIQALAFQNAKIVEVPLSDLPAAVGEAGAYIGNDTGLKHLCAALGMKSFTFFGPEDPLEWHPYDRCIHPLVFAKEEGLSNLREISPRFVFDRLFSAGFCS